MSVPTLVGNGNGRGGIAYAALSWVVMLEKRETRSEDFWELGPLSASWGRFWRGRQI
jgi:hypothetical protein